MPKSNQNNKVDKKLAYGLIALAVVAGIIIVALFAMPKTPDNGETTQTTAPTSVENATTEATVPTVLVENQVEASYEYWLAGAMSMAATLDYPEFSEMELYVTGETPMNSKMDSQGAYLRLTTPEGVVLFYSAPLADARTEAGSKDLYSTQLGFNTFQVLEDGDLDLSAYQQVTLDDLAEVIRQATLVSVYEN